MMSGLLLGMVVSDWTWFCNVVAVPSWLVSTDLINPIIIIIKLKLVVYIHIGSH
jgi:hypothetical protein